jgi:hypothetical protein
VLISAVIKISQQSQIDKVKTLYRGLAMGCNPKALLPPFTTRFQTERCMISTTKKQELAIKFSGLWRSGVEKELKHWPTIFEIDTGALELGADITCFSQYSGAKLSSTNS